MQQRPKVFITFALIVLIVVGAYFVDIPGGPDINIGSYSKELKTQLGLDLSGGTQLIYKADLSKIDSADADTAMSSVRDVIERRVNAFGVSEPLVQTSTSGGERRLIVELAGVTDINTAIQLIGQTPLLEFKEPDSTKTEPPTIDTSTLDSADAAAIAQIQAQQDAYFKSTGLTGAMLSRAQVDFDQTTGQPQVAIKFNSEGSKLFSEITKRNINKPLAIYLDGAIISAPLVNVAITTGDAVISGSFTLDEAKNLAERLNAGALPVPISLLSQQTIGASLGQDSIERSLVAGFIGMILIALFMIAHYRLPGFIAVLGLCVYALVLLALFKLVPVTVTLAGIAGFILSLGIAVDANVLVFERIREEMRHGAEVNKAVTDGFKHAWLSIRDSNLSTLISCIILGWFGTSIIKGFAVTLGIGIFVSLFTGIIVTRTLLRLITMTPLVKAQWLFLAPRKRKEETPHA